MFKMGKVAVVLYVAAMAAIIVAVDFAFFRHRFMERLIVNIGIVLVFTSFLLPFSRSRNRRALGNAGQPDAAPAL